MRVSRIGKGKMTREMIIAKAAALFNSRGYFGASMSDLMQATGLEKGGIYNHFDNKEELAMAAFDYAVATTSAYVKGEVDKCDGAIAKLHAFVNAVSSAAESPPVPGGCPLLNSAIECDDAHPELKERVQAAITRVRRFLASIIKSGIDANEIKADVDAEKESLVIFATLEGGLMISRLFDQTPTMSSIAQHLKEHIDSLKA